MLLRGEGGGGGAGAVQGRDEGTVVGVHEEGDGTAGFGGLEAFLRDLDSVHLKFNGFLNYMLNVETYAKKIRFLVV